MKGENILEISNLVVEYHTDDNVIHAVNGVNLQIKKGETLGLRQTGAENNDCGSIMRILQTRRQSIATAGSFSRKWI